MYLSSCLSSISGDLISIIVMKISRGAKPLQRHSLVTSQPYRRDSHSQVFVPSRFPSTDYELSEALLYKQVEPLLF